MTEHKVNLLDFSKMRINLSLMEEGQTVLEAFPQLKHIPAYVKATDDEIIVAILLCDRSGPFSTIKNFEQRLNAIFSWMKYDAMGDQAGFYQDILAMRLPNIPDIWTEYLPAIFDHEWTTWFSNSILYYQIMTELRKPVDMADDKDFDSKWNKRLKIEQRADAVYKKMKEMEDILFLDEVIKRRSADREREKKIENYPEKFAVSDSVV